MLHNDQVVRITSILYPGMNCFMGLILDCSNPVMIQVKLLGSDTPRTVTLPAWDLEEFEDEDQAKAEATMNML